MGKSSGGTTQTVQKSDPWVGAQPYLLDVFGKAKGLYGDNKKDLRYANKMFGPKSESSQMLQSTISGDYLHPESNPYLKNTVGAAMGQAKTAVNANFSGDNFGNSAHQEWLGNQMAGAAIPAYMQNYQMERGRQFDANTAQQQNYGLLQNAKWGPLQNYQQAVSGSGGGTSTNQEPYHENKAASAASTAMQAYMMYMLASSDRRLKRDIERIGTHKKGFGIYSFRYIWGDKFHVGVMADEVEPVIPEAVLTDSRGFKMVNYSMLGA